MGRESVIAVLVGEADAGTATAMTWMPAGAARELAWGFGVENEPEALAGLARALGVDLAFVHSSQEWAAEAVRALSSQDVAAGWIVDGVFTRLAEANGWMRTLGACAEAPEVVSDDLDLMLQDAIHDVARGVDAGADVLLIADELAGAAGWIVSPDFVIDSLIPRYRRLAEARPSNLPVAFHSDGDIRVIYRALAAAGFSAIHVAVGQRGSMDAAFRAVRTSGLVPIGGIEAQRLLADGARQAGSQARLLAAGGPAVVSDDGGLSTTEDVRALGVALAAFRADTEPEPSRG